jgi:hypothetical protein
VSLAQLLTEPISVLRYGAATDDYGNTVPGGETRTTYLGRLEQMRAEEILRDRDTVIADWRAFLPPDVDLTPYDRIEARGVLFEVVGLPAQQWSPRGAHHVEVQLRYVV